VNRLVQASDVRHLIVDAFSLRHSIRPSGTEISPGVWLDTNAWLHPKARVAGPVYIGRGARVQSTALVARYSSVESSCNIGCGTVIADASILAQTYLGAWLDVSHSVVYGSKVANLRHNVVVDIKDDRLIRRTSAVPPFRRLFPGLREF
jgi:mannose-1-phosphate guanylyltransferase/phosphomannomutase